MRTFLIVFFLLAAANAKSQHLKTGDFCQYLNQPIRKLLTNLKSSVVDTTVTKTPSGTVHSFLLIFKDSSYFEVFPLLNKTTDVANTNTNLKSYVGCKIRCIFYYVPGEVVDNCGCKSLFNIETKN
jgi:hypothetical protein